MQIASTMDILTGCGHLLLLFWLASYHPGSAIPGIQFVREDGDLVRNIQVAIFVYNNDVIRSLGMAI